MNRMSLYEKLGGRDALDTAIGAFYFNLMNDRRVARFFTDVNVQKLIEHQKQFFTVAFGGPGAYDGRRLRDAHRDLVEKQGLSHDHFDAVLENLALTLTDLGIDDVLVNEATASIEALRDHVLG